ncbi:MAG: hypothetical protein U1F43_31470 [Myxococcota bacterium]
MALDLRRRGRRAGASCRADRSCDAATLAWEAGCGARRSARTSAAPARSSPTARRASSARPPRRAARAPGAPRDTSCTAIIEAACGAADGGDSAAPPSADLCAGSASAVEGNGPFTWTCAGQAGGRDARCSANRAARRRRSAGPGFRALGRGVGRARRLQRGHRQRAAPGFVGGATATCTQGAWATDDVSCVEVIDAACGPAEGGSTLAAPTSRPCWRAAERGRRRRSVRVVVRRPGRRKLGELRRAPELRRGRARPTGDGLAGRGGGRGGRRAAPGLVNAAPGFSGGATASCAEGHWAAGETSCVEIIDAACGAADGGGTLSAPTSGLCATGAPSAVEGRSVRVVVRRSGRRRRRELQLEPELRRRDALTWGASCSAAAASAPDGASGALTNSAAGYVSGATATCSQGAWSTSATSCVEIIVGARAERPTAPAR